MLYFSYIFLIIYFCGYLNCFLQMYRRLHIDGFLTESEKYDVDILGNIVFIILLSTGWFFVTLEDED